MPSAVIAIPTESSSCRLAQKEPAGEVFVIPADGANASIEQGNTCPISTISIPQSGELIQERRAESHPNGLQQPIVKLSP